MTSAEKNSLKEHGIGKNNTAEESANSSRKWVQAVTGTENALLLTAAATRQLIQFLRNSITRVLFIVVKELSTGVLTA